MEKITSGRAPARQKKAPTTSAAEAAINSSQTIIASHQVNVSTAYLASQRAPFEAYFFLVSCGEVIG